MARDLSAAWRSIRRSASLTDQDGPTYHFCSASCRDKLFKVLQEYITSINPVCGMRVERATAANFARHEGKGFYFCSPGCKGRIEAESRQFLGLAPLSRAATVKVSIQARLPSRPRYRARQGAWMKDSSPITSESRSAAAALLTDISFHNRFTGPIAGSLVSAALVESDSAPSPKHATPRGIYGRTTRGIRIYLATSLVCWRSTWRSRRPVRS